MRQLSLSHASGIANSLAGAHRININLILTCFVNASEENSGRQVRHSFTKEKRYLLKLVEARQWGSDQLICFLHGPGGSGKTTVIDVVINMHVHTAMKLKILNSLPEQ